MKNPESRPIQKDPEWRESWTEAPEVNFFNDTKKIRRDFLKIMKENLNLGKIKSTKIDSYLKMLADLEVARDFLRLKENKLDQTDPEWLNNINTLSGIRYSLGSIQSHFLDRLHSLIALKRKKSKGTNNARRTM